MSTTSSNLSLTLAEPGDLVNVESHIADNFALLDTKWSTAGAPAAVQVGAAGTPGSSTVVARSDHVHGITTATPVSIGTGNSAGIATTVSASDHVHKIDNLGVTTALINDLAVTTGKLNDLAVTTGKLNDLAVTTVKLNDSAVTTAKIADSNVTTAKIADSNVTTAKIADSNVTAAKIADSNVTTAKLNNAAVTIGKIDAIDAPANDEVFTYDSASGRGEWQAASSLVSTSIADNSITTAKLEAIAKPLLGRIEMYSGPSETPVSAAGYKFCNGQLISRTTFAAYFALVGTTYGAGDGSTTFNVPNLLDRVPVGAGSSYTLGQALGAVSPNIDHVHGMSSHNHGASALGVGGSTGGPSSTTNVGGGSGTAADGSHTHGTGSLDVTGNTDGPSTSNTQSASVTTVDVRQPSLGVHFIVYVGVAS